MEFSNIINVPNVHIWYVHKSDVNIRFYKETNVNFALTTNVDIRCKTTSTNIVVLKLMSTSGWYTYQVSTSDIDLC